MPSKSYLQISLCQKTSNTVIPVWSNLVMHNLNMKRCSYYSASETSADQIKIKEQSAEYTVILDDLQNLTDTTERESYFEVICKLLSLNNVWLILIARCPFVTG